MRTSLLITLFLTIICSLSAQTPSLKNILAKSRNFQDIVTEGDRYFAAKHPGRQPEELAQGPFRDSEYVKFQRWQHFWKDRLNADGTLGDLSLPAKSAAMGQQQKSSLNPYATVAWTEINYTNYITGQIGLGRTTSMAFHPTDVNTFYVGAAIGGIWKTTDGGQSYVPLGDDLPFLAVSAIVVDQNTPNTLYIAISDHVWYGPQGIGIYKSTDGGASWNATALSFSFSQNIRIYAMVANPTDPDEIYVATAGGLYKTTDGFATVNQIQAGDCRDVRLRPGNAGTVYAGMSDGSIMGSTDGGNTFTRLIDLGNSPILLAVSPLNNQQVWARHGNFLFRSDNAGGSFANVGTFSESNEVFAVAPNTTSVILSGNFDCHRSNNGGGSFSPTSDWLGRSGLPLVHVDQRNIFINPLENDAVYYCNDGGVYRYNVSTNSFDNLSDGLAITQYYDIAVAQTDANIIGGGSQDNGNVFRQSDGSWLQYASTGDGMNQEIDPTDAGIRYWAYQNGSINRWQNGINTSIRPAGTSGGAWETPYKIDPSNPSRLVIGYRQVWESFDRGNSWSAISNNLSGGNMNELAIAPANGERIYVTSGSNLYVKSTTSDNWTNRSLPFGNVSDIEVDPLDIDKVYVSVSGYSAGNKVYVSTDAGANWVNISDNLPNTSVGALELYHDAPGGVFVGTDLGVFYRDDSHTEWLAYGDLPNTRVEDIEIQYAARLIRVGTHGRGVLEAPVNITGCTASSQDTDGDGVCDLLDSCPNLDNSLIGTACDDGNPNTSGETYDADCGCSGGVMGLSHCAAAGRSGTGADWINNISLNGVNHPSSKSAYSDFRSTVIPLETETEYPMSVSLNATFPEDRIYAWADWNQDGVFAEEERIDFSLPAGNNGTALFTVPGYAQEGQTTLRVRVIYSTTINDPCGDFFGEVEDYTIAVSCSSDCDGGSSDVTSCTAAGRNGTGADWINGVTLGSMQNASGQSAYSDFRDIVTPVTVNQLYPLSVSLNYSFDIDRLYAWVDWDQDGNFTAQERIDLSQPPVNVPSATGSATLIVPGDAMAGATTMRVRAIYSTTQSDPCGSSLYGEVEDYTLYVNCPGGCVAFSLPLEWEHFRAHALKAGSAYLRWRTSAEEAVAHYRIERSTDGRSFVSIATTPARNGAEQTYDFTDDEASGQLAYYRIVGVDLDGTENFSPVETVVWLPTNENVTLYPNPVNTGTLTVAWQAQPERQYQYYLYNSYGQQIRQQQLPPVAPGSQTINLTTAGLPAGVYLLRMRSHDWDWTGNFVVR